MVFCQLHGLYMFILYIISRLLCEDLMLHGHPCPCPESHNSNFGSFFLTIQYPTWCVFGGPILSIDICDIPQLHVGNSNSAQNSLQRLCIRWSMSCRKSARSLNRGLLGCVATGGTAPSDPPYHDRYKPFLSCRMYISNQYICFMCVQIGGKVLPNHFVCSGDPFAGIKVFPREYTLK